MHEKETAHGQAALRGFPFGKIIAMQQLLHFISEEKVRFAIQSILDIKIPKNKKPEFPGSRKPSNGKEKPHKSKKSCNSL
ncbi:MAG: hypothetical protein IJ682_04770 [Lachnospiraceae bacterium]|nr:hypothetical protein [Lachnospiraceae bacterium]